MYPNDGAQRKGNVSNVKQQLNPLHDFTHLMGEEDVLAGLRHGSVRYGNHEDGPDDGNIKKEGKHAQTRRIHVHGGGEWTRGVKKKKNRCYRCNDAPALHEPAENVS